MKNKFRGYSPIVITALIVMAVASSVTLFAIEGLTVGVIISGVIGAILLEIVFDVTYEFKEDCIVRRNGFFFTKMKYDEIIDIRKVNLKAVGPCSIVSKESKIMVALVFKQADFNDVLFEKVKLEDPVLDLDDID